MPIWTMPLAGSWACKLSKRVYLLALLGHTLVAHVTGHVYRSAPRRMIRCDQAVEQAVGGR